MPVHRDRTPPRTALSRERVLRAGLELADVEGIDSLSMRRLAQRLDVEAMSLYHHVRNKQDLLGGLLDLVYAEIDLPAGATDWRADVRRTAISFHHVLLQHPWACGLFTLPLDIGPARQRYMDALLGRLRSAGFSAVMTHHAYHALDSHIVGFTLWVLPYLAAAQQQPGLAERFLEELPADEYPYLVEHIGVHLAPPADDVDEFEFGLDLVLDGLGRLSQAKPQAGQDLAPLP
jgi:AcrR family transcriptional regulator